MCYWLIEWVGCLLVGLAIGALIARPSSVTYGAIIGVMIGSIATLFLDLILVGSLPIVEGDSSTGCAGDGGPNCPPKPDWLPQPPPASPVIRWIDVDAVLAEVPTRKLERMERYETSAVSCG